MARLKYADGATPLRHKHGGFTFIPNAYGQSVLRGQANDRYRRPAQDLRKQNIVKAINAWSELDPAIKLLWDDFAAAYPQPAKSDPDIFLTGYQTFIKRNHYCFLNDDLPGVIITVPELSALPDPDFAVGITQGAQSIDLTDLYIARFGLLPETGQFVICKVIPTALESGQFFAPLQATLVVENVYMDGLFANFEFSGDPGPVSFSLYLSKPVHESVQYQSTKFRYMGCFKPTTFLQLTDTPSSYEGQAGKIVSVKDDETGVEFTVPGGGGINCADLLGCSIIQQILDQLEAVGQIVSEGFDTSVPPVKYGLMYNWWAAQSIASIVSSPDWGLLNLTGINAFRTAVGGLAVGGGNIKEVGLTHWNSPNSGAVNSFGYNARGAGYRLFNGNFSSLKAVSWQWSSQQSSASFAYVIQCINSDTQLQINTLQKVGGCAIRLSRAAPGEPDGVIGTYVGNDGRVYRTITIGQREFLADNLAETKFADGTDIPEIAVNAAWAGLTTPALCAFNNDWANV